MATTVTHWIRYAYQGETGFGTLKQDQIEVYQGDMFDQPQATGDRLELAAVTTLTPSVPSKMIGLWNNLQEQSTKFDFPTPANPWYFIKTPNTYMAAGGVIKRPAFYQGSIIFEAELGIVIGKQCFGVSEQEADDFIFGYTCVNDVTAIKLIKEDPFYEQWTRAKCFDGFAPMGPVVASGIDPEKLIIRGILNGKEHQNYPVSDMIFTPRQLVSLISRDMTLMPGDVISCGTSLGSKSMWDPSNEVEIAIDGIGSLKNKFE